MMPKAVGRLSRHFETMWWIHWPGALLELRVSVLNSTGPVFQYSMSTTKEGAAQGLESDLSDYASAVDAICQHDCTVFMCWPRPGSYAPHSAPLVLDAIPPSAFEGQRDSHPSAAMPPRQPHTAPLNWPTLP